jgi:hypothetical protein
MNYELKRAHISVVPTKSSAWILAGIIATVLLLVLLGLFVRPA